MSSYTINLTDPLSPSFTLSAFASNGTIFPTSPVLNSTSVSASTSLLIYGKGSPSYGERIQEDIIHVMENFYGATEPVNPITGQLWYTDITVIQTSLGWYRWNATLSTWEAITVSVVALPTTPPIVDNTYYVNDAAPPELFYGVDNVNQPQSPTWLQRAYDDHTTAGDPNAVGIVPRKVLRVWTGEEWDLVNSVYASPDFGPSNPVEGDLWVDTGGDQSLKVWISGSWNSIITDISALVAKAGDTMDSGANLIFAGGGQVLGLPATPVGDSAATSKLYVDTLVPTSLSDLTETATTSPLAGTFLRGNGTIWQNHSLLLSDVIDVTASNTEVNRLSGVTSNVQTQLNNRLLTSGGTITGSLTVNAATNTNTLTVTSTSTFGDEINMSLSKIVNLADPDLPQDAATRNYVDSAVAGGGVGTFVEIAGDTMTGNLLLPATTGATPGLAAVTKDYVDSLSSGDTFVTSGAVDAGGILTLTRNDAGTIVVPGFAPAVHTHDSKSEILYTAAEGTLLAEVPYSTSTIGEATDALDSVIQIRTTPTRSIQTTVAPTSVFTVPPYETGSDKLFVFLNGVKSLASTQGSQGAAYNNISPLCGNILVGLAAATYTATVDVDGTPGAESLSINGSLVTTMCELIDAINAQLTLSTAVYERGQIRIYSDTHGSPSAINITDTGAIIGSQTEVVYDGVGFNGTFVGGDGVGGTAYVVSEQITLSDSSVITVDAVDANGDVTAFTVTTPGVSIPAGITLTQTSTTGTGTDFTLTPQTNNLVNPLFASINNFTGLTPPDAGLTLDYQEAGVYGTVNTSITFNVPVPTSETIEFIVLGGVGY